MSPRPGWLARAARACWPRSRRARLLLVGLGLLLLLALVGPVLSLARLLTGLAAAVLAPLLGDPAGRLALVGIGLLVGLWLALRSQRGRIRDLRAALLLRRHQHAVAAAVGTDPRRARTLLARVARSRGPTPAEYPWVRADACIKLARLALDAGEPGRAQGWLLRVRDADLPPELARACVQLRAQAEVAAPGALPESAERVVGDGLQRFPEDPVLLRLLRDLLAGRGAQAEAAEVQERVARIVPQREERVALARSWLQAAVDAAAAGRREEAAQHLGRARAADPGLAAASLLGGELLLQEGDWRGALRAWSAIPSRRALARCAEVVAARGLAPREILETCQTKGALLLAAQAYAARGEARRASRAARLAERLLGTTPTVAEMLGEARAAATAAPAAAARP